MRPPPLGRAYADFNYDPSLCHAPMTGPGNLRIGVNKGGDHARDAGSGDRVDTWRRLAVMRAGLERNIERRPARRGTGAAQRLGFSMRPPARLSPTPADDYAVPDDDRADGGVGPSASQPALAEREGKHHEAGVFRAMVGVAQ